MVSYRGEEIALASPCTPSASRCVSCLTLELFEKAVGPVHQLSAPGASAAEFAFLQSGFRSTEGMSSGKPVNRRIPSGGTEGEKTLLTSHVA